MSFQVAGASATYTVVPSADAVDANVGDGVCAASSGLCTLRAAIMEANSTSVADTIHVSAGTYTLAIGGGGDNGPESGDLDIERPVTIIGTAGAAATIVDAGAPPGNAPPEQRGMDRLIETSETAGNVTVRGLTLREGYHSDIGGAVMHNSTGTLRFEHSVIKDSYAVAFGGGISSSGGGRLELVSTTVSGNGSVGEGGGVHVDSGGLVVSGTQAAPSLVENNTAREGGGVYHAGGESPAGLPGSVTLSGVTITGNTAEGVGGGASIGGDSSLTITDTTFSENVAEDGGGIDVSGEVGVEVTRATFVRNAAHGYGGGAHTASQRAVEFLDTTFSENTAGDPVSGDGGGAGLTSTGTGTLTIDGGLFTKNRAISAGGGAEFGNFGATEISGTEFRENHSDSGGGGFVNAGNNVTASEVLLVKNTTSGIGGAILGEGSGNFTLVGSSVHSNTAVSGGGFANEADGTTNITSTTFWDNRALAGSATEDAGLGGGVFSLGDASATYENVTITGNYAQTIGGGFYVDADAPVRIVSSTISRNTAPVASGVGTEVSVQPIPPEPSQGVIFRNSILGGNFLSPDCNFAVGSEGGNIESTDSCYLRGPRDRNKIADMKLDAVADNGGPVMTMAMHEDSYALDGGIAPCTMTDARGEQRPAPNGTHAGVCDIGAYEHTGPFSPPDTEDPVTLPVQGPAQVAEMADFLFSATDNMTSAADMLYECRLINLLDPPDPQLPNEPPDPEWSFLGCPNPHEDVLVEEGPNRLDVRAVDRKGNVDETHVEFFFEAGVDSIAPVVDILRAPKSDNGRRTTSFSFQASDNLTEAILLETECRLDSTDENAWVECASPHSVSNLTDGPHTFEVRAIDELENMSQPIACDIAPGGGNAAGDPFIDPTPTPCNVYTWTVGDADDCTDANITLVADADAYVDEVDTQSNFGSETSLLVNSGAPGQDQRSLVRFAVPPASSAPSYCTLQSATLRLSGEGDPGRTLQAIPVTQSWIESQVTWLNQPTVSANPATIATTQSGAGVREWNVTEQIRAIRTGGPNHGFQIRDAVEEDETGAGHAFVSRHVEQDPTVPSTLPELVLRFDGPNAVQDPPPAEGTIDPLIKCGKVVTASLKLHKDLTNCPADGLVVGANNIEIDLNGFSITGPGYFEGDPGSPIEVPEIGGPAGIRNVGYSNVVVTGGPVVDGKPTGLIKNFMFGVAAAAGTRWSVIEDVRIERNSTSGVEFIDADDGRNGNTVRGVHFTGNELGLSLLDGSENSDIVGNDFQGNRGYAIWMSEASRHFIHDNDISGVMEDPLLSSDGGITMLVSPDNEISLNRMSDTGDGGVVVNEGSHRNTFQGNTFSRVGDAGINASGSDDLVFDGNRAHSSSDAGISVSDSSGGRIENNRVEFNPTGIELSSVTDMEIVGNFADFSSGDGISVGGDSHHNTIEGNRARWGSGTGISIDVDGLNGQGLPIGNLIKSNVTNGNMSDGIQVTGAGHTVRQNNADGNAAFGIRAAVDTIDGGGNAARENGEPEQCENVLCGPETDPAHPNDPMPSALDPETEIVDANLLPTTVSNIDTMRLQFKGTWMVNGVDYSLALRFQCRLDAPPDPPPPPVEPGEPPQPPDVDNWVECASPEVYPFLPEGPHKFEVRAVSPFDRVDLEPAFHEWGVLPVPPGDDDTLPRVTITSAPTDPSNDRSVVFGFRGTDNMTPGPYMRYKCSLGPTSSPAPTLTWCSPGYSEANLQYGTEYRFRVVSVDLANNESPVAEHVWNVEEPPADETPPDTMILGGPDPITVDTEAEFTFTADEPGTTFQCRITTWSDWAAWHPCTSPFKYTGVPVGSHTFEVAAIDAAGNADVLPAGSPAARQWRVGPAPTPTAVNCGQVITQSVRVTQDLIDCASDGLVVGANEITIDLGGVMIDGIGQGVGIRNDGFDSVTIKNGAVQQFDTGVALNPGTTRNIVTGVTAQLNQEVGILLANADNGSVGSTVRSNLVAGNAYGIQLLQGTQGAMVIDNTIGGTAEDALQIVGGGSNRVERNTISSTSGVAVHLEGSTNNSILSNTISGTSKQAISLQLGSNGNAVEGNALDSSEVGVEILESNDNTVTANEAAGMNGPGIGLDTANDNTVTANDVSGNKDGIELYNADNNAISSNTANDNDSNGIAVGDQSHGNTVFMNTASQNNSQGISVEAEVAEGSPDPANVIEQNITNGNSSAGIAVNKMGHQIRANVANNNTGWGIYAENGNWDRGGNRATGNVELEQCYNVVCDGSAPMGPEVAPPDTSIVSGPANPTSSRSASFTFSGVDDNTPAFDIEFQCRLDSTSETAWVDCENPQTYSSLPPGWRMFEVRAVDLSGKVDASPAQYPWLIEAPSTGIAPDTTNLTVFPSVPAGAEEVVFSFASNEAVASFQCSIDGGAFTACTSPHDVADLQYGQHVFRVRAVDADGNVDPSPAEFSWTRTGPPVVTITAGPDEVTTSRRAEFAFTANEPVQRFECSIDLAPYAACSSPTEYLNLAIGDHNIRVRAVDMDNLTSGPDELAEYEWVIEPGIDTEPPVTIWQSTPPSSSASSTFTFTGTDNVTAPAGLIFECRLDSTDEGDFRECVSPFTLPNPDFPDPLVAGPHRLDVRAVDESDNIAPHITHLWTFTGDTVAPTVTILAQPQPVTASTSGTVVFSANDPYAEFECSLNGELFEACSTPHELSGLEPGQQSLQVRALDLTGNIGAPVTVTWEVIESPIVAITTTPPPSAPATTAMFAFSTAEPAATFTCSLDGTAYTACTSPVNLTGLAVGMHTFAVRASAYDAVGDPTVYQWTVTPPPDTVAPDTTVVTGPPATTTSTSATFTFSASEAGSTFACSLDNAAFTPCTSPREVTGLAVGAHSMRIQATDAAGNTDASPATHNWTVQSSAPPPPTCPTAPINLGSGRDSWVLQSSATSNYGSDSILKLDSKTSNNARALVRFELPTIPTGCVVTGATLRLHAASAATGRTLQALRISAPWTEAGVTWSNQPATGGTAATTTSGTGWRTWTVTDLVTAMYAGTNHGFLIRDASENSTGKEQQLHSREKGSDNPPQLVLTIGPAGGSQPPPGGGPDTTAPNTTVDTGPTSTTASTTATFTFSSSESGSTFQCSLDGAAFTACTSPKEYTGLALAAHTFQVRATDAAGNTDASPAAHNWSVTNSCAGAGSVTIGANADSWLLQSSASSNYGSDSVLKMDSKSGNNARALVRFPLPTIPAGCQVTGATLKLYAGSHKTGRTLQALQVTAAWTESNVRWNNQPSTATAAATTTSGSGYRSWSVTQQVAAMYATANHGFLIRDAAENSNGQEQQFHSREKGTDNPPQLVITFG